VGVKKDRTGILDVDTQSLEIPLVQLSPITIGSYGDTVSR
jgi:hypothetical protein